MVLTYRITRVDHVLTLIIRWRIPMLDGCLSRGVLSEYPNEYRHQ